MKTNKKRNRGVVLWVFEWGEREREEEEEEEEDWGLGFKKSKKKGLKMKNMREREMWEIYLWAFSFSYWYRESSGVRVVWLECFFVWLWFKRSKISKEVGLGVW